ncbi:uncharacterized protein BJ171DRAFT_476828 [Polychytrium aggregatum]|uniref:uncharacterized protein n=1 Tax=Polychytrium aggregatum TaxID=110093 RepID=UPI0022FE285C|nr:uncharacterized protein BJ171DRAFT_476828 [Polychytrium aggregatum]KAI9202154.1 hypothetical protein BJ171DRAFT_476828 [Polychytrium aggregatum]
MSSYTDKAKDAANYVAAVADPYLPQTVKTAVSTVVDKAVAAYPQVHSYATEKYTQVVDYGKVAYNGVTTTITAYTPGPVMTIVNQTLESTKSVRETPVEAIKQYVPTFVVESGEKTYEIVKGQIHATREKVDATSGYIVEKVNGTVSQLVHIPQVESIIHQLQTLTEPVLSKIGVHLPELSHSTEAATDDAAPAATEAVPSAESQ